MIQRTTGLTAFFAIADRARDGFLAIEKIVFSDSKEPPAVDVTPNRYVTKLLATPGLNSIDDLAAAYQAAYAAALVESKPDMDTDWLLAAVAPTGALDDLAALNTPVAVQLRRSRVALEQAFPESQYAMVSHDSIPRDIPISMGGRYANPGPMAPRRFLSMAAKGVPEPFRQGSGRLELADKIASADNPLTPRVMVNRIWKHHFGAGLVRSVDNFGLTGDRPSHPELLDYLAAEFVRNNWSVKTMHRLIVLSNTYRTSSEASAEALDVDPANRLLQHAPVRRLEAEAIRDSILAVSGELDRTLYGHSIPPHVSEHQDGRGRPISGPVDGDGRRSVYLEVRRNFITPLLLAFDYPVPNTAAGSRGVTAVPSQSLMLMNNELARQQAAKWAARMESFSGDGR